MSDAPGHILTRLRILRTQPKEVCDIVTPFIKTGAWTVHSENLLISLLVSKDQTDRKFAVQKILEIREDNSSGRHELQDQADTRFHSVSYSDNRTHLLE